jgi:ABC-type multidrug transport system ATPase subunit
LAGSTLRAPVFRQAGPSGEGPDALLCLVGLWERRDDYVKRFSGSMKRRLEIVRALQHRPRILFLDEPTSGLDPQTRNQIWDFIRGLSRDETVTVFLPPITWKSLRVAGHE